MFQMILLINKITFHRTTEVKPLDVKSNTYAECNVDFKEKKTKFKVDDNVRISKHNIFAKGYPPIWSEEVFVIS